MTTKTMLALLLAGLSLNACGRGGGPAEPAEDKLPTLDVTHWTEKTELFMEYPPLVAGQPALFAIHLTNMADFTPISAAQARLEFTPESGGATKALVGPKPSRPGAFRIEEPPPAPGRYKWALVLEAPGLSDRHDLGTTTVFSDEQTARADAGK